MNIRAANGREIVLGPGLEPLRTKNAAGSRSTWFDGGNRTTWPLVNTRAFVASRKGIRSREDWSAFAIIAASHHALGAIGPASRQAEARGGTTVSRSGDMSIRTRMNEWKARPMDLRALKDSPPQDWPDNVRRICSISFGMITPPRPTWFWPPSSPATPRSSTTRW